MNIVIAVLLVIAATYLAFLSSKDSIFKANRITKGGWKFIVSYFVIIVFTVAQVIFTKLESDRKEVLFRDQQNTRDSVLKAQYDSSLSLTHLRTIATITEALGKYGFKFDSVNQRLIQLVRDSSKTRIIMPEEPALILAIEDGIVFERHENGVFRFKIRLASMQAASTNFILSLSALVRDSAKNVLGFYPEFKDIQKDMVIPANVGFDLFLLIPLENITIPRHLDILIKGRYTNLDGTKSHQINSLYGYDFKLNDWGLIDGPTREIVLSTMEQLRNAK
jgi:hypothetical protein